MDPTWFIGIFENLLNFLLVIFISGFLFFFSLSLPAFLQLLVFLEEWKFVFSPVLICVVVLVSLRCGFGFSFVIVGVIEGYVSYLRCMVSGCFSSLWLYVVFVLMVLGGAVFRWWHVLSWGLWCYIGGSLQNALSGKSLKWCISFQQR